MSLTDELCGRTFEFGRVDGSRIGTITLLQTGEFAGYQNPNERSWAIENGRLAFRDESGLVTTVFSKIE
jgi:hypothetical protein